MKKQGVLTVLAIVLLLIMIISVKVVEKKRNAPPPQAENTAAAVKVLPTVDIKDIAYNRRVFYNERV